MLKNKKSLYLLLPVTLIIWALIGYKVYQYLNQEEEDLLPDTLLVSQGEDKTISDSFTVFNNYRDPFLGDNSKELAPQKEHSSSGSYARSNPSYSKNNQANGTGKKQPAADAAANNTWPKIVYNGMITNSTRQQSIAFVSIDGISNRVKTGDLVAGLKVIAFTANDITLARGKEKKIFGK